MGSLTRSAVERPRRIRHSRGMRFSFVILAVPVVLAACASEPPRAAPPTRPPVVSSLLPAPPVPADWRDVPQTPGTWTYRQDARGSIALFGPVGADALLTLRCDSATRNIYLSKAGTADTPLTLRTSSTTRVLPVRATGAQPAYVAAALTANDPLLDAIGFSRGRFVVSQAGGATLAIPAWAEVERVTQDCRG